MKYDGYTPGIFEATEVTVNIEENSVQELNCGTQQVKKKEEVGGDI